MKQATEHLHEPVLAFARKDFTTLQQDLTVEQALDAVGQHGVGEKIVYFYVVDQDQRLLGVVPTRRLLIAPLDQRISNLMIDRVVTIPHTATLLEACEAFVLLKLLAFPLLADPPPLARIL